MGDKPVPRYKEIRAIKDRVIKRLQCSCVFLDVQSFFHQLLALVENNGRNSAVLLLQSSLREPASSSDSRTTNVAA